VIRTRHQIEDLQQQAQTADANSARRRPARRPPIEQHQMNPLYTADEEVSSRRSAAAMPRRLRRIGASESMLRFRTGAQQAHRRFGKRHRRADPRLRRQSRCVSGSAQASRERARVDEPRRGATRPDLPGTESGGDAAGAFGLALHAFRCGRSPACRWPFRSVCCSRGRASIHGYARSTSSSVLTALPCSQRCPFYPTPNDRRRER
jgi:hypothetical protein